MQLLDHPLGNYRFYTGIAPYSAGVVAMSGHEIVRVTLQQPVPYQQGFALIEQHLAGLGRPRQALCAVELRLPAPRSFTGWRCRFCVTPPTPRMRPRIHLSAPRQRCANIRSAPISKPGWSKSR